MLKNPVLFALVLVLEVAAQSGPMHLTYGVEVRPDDPGKYHFRVEVTNPEQGPGRAELVLVMPYWAPGAYRGLTLQVRGGPPAISGFRGFTAEDEAGAGRTVTAAGERQWKVDVRGAKRITFRYTNENPGKAPNNRSFLADDTGVIDGPRSWVYVDGMKHLPAHVHFTLPEGWKVGTGLDPTFDPFVFHADDYDRLVDCPTAVGLFHEWIFHVRGVPHRILALTGASKPRFDPEPMISLTRRIVETYVAIFDDVPYQHYTFVYTSGGGGGLEHLTSTSISAGRATSLDAAALADVTAHEFFHTWNVKRLRPKLLGPFDYTGPVRVKDLWICEGLTSYYGTLGLWRAGVMNDRAFLASYAANIKAWQRSAGHLVVSPEEASWTVWDRNKSYSMDYYMQGEVLGLLIDLAIRDATENRKGFDDVMRRLYRTFGGYYRHQPPSPGFESDDVLRCLIEETGADLTEFWDRHVRSAGEVDWNRHLRTAGWEIETREERVPALATLRGGEPSDPGLIVRVDEGDPLHRAGFRDGDGVKSVGGTGIRAHRNFNAQFRALGVGSAFVAEVVRDGKTIEVKGTVEPASDLTTIVVEDGDDGVRVRSAPSGTAAAKAGLARGDIVVSFDGQPAGDAEALSRKLWRPAVGAEIRLQVRRQGAVRDLVVRAAERVAIDVGKLNEVAEPTPRQLAIRQGLKQGTTLAVGAAGGAR